MSLYKNIGPITFVFESDTAEIFSTSDQWLLQMKKWRSEVESSSTCNALTRLEEIVNKYNDYLGAEEIHIYSESGKPPSLNVYRSHMRPWILESELSFEDFWRVCNCMVDSLEWCFLSETENFDKKMFFNFPEVSKSIYINLSSGIFENTENNNSKNKSLEKEKRELEQCKKIIKFLEGFSYGDDSTCCQLVLRKIKKCKSLEEIKEEIQYFRQIYEIGAEKGNGLLQSQKTEKKGSLVVRRKSTNKNRQYFFQNNQKVEERHIIRDNLSSTHQSLVKTNGSLEKVSRKGTSSIHTLRNERYSLPSKTLGFHTERSQTLHLKQKGQKGKGLFWKARQGSPVNLATTTRSSFGNVRNTLKTCSQNSQSSIRNSQFQKEDSSHESLLEISQSSGKQISGKEEERYEKYQKEEEVNFRQNKQSKNEIITEKLINAKEIHNVINDKINDWKEKRKKHSNNNFRKSSDFPETTKTIKRKSKLPLTEEGFKNHQEEEVILDVMKSEKESIEMKKSKERIFERETIDSNKELKNVETNWNEEKQLQELIPHTESRLESESYLKDIIELDTTEIEEIKLEDKYFSTKSSIPEKKSEFSKVNIHPKPTEGIKNSQVDEESFNKYEKIEKRVQKEKAKKTNFPPSPPKEELREIAEKENLKEELKGTLKQKIKQSSKEKSKETENIHENPKEKSNQKKNEKQKKENEKEKENPKEKLKQKETEKEILNPQRKSEEKEQSKETSFLLRSKKLLETVDLIGECVSLFPSKMSEIKTGDKFLWQLPAFLLYKAFYIQRLSIYESLLNTRPTNPEIVKFVEDVFEENQQIYQSLMKLAKSCEKKTKKFIEDPLQREEICELVRSGLEENFAGELARIGYNFLCEVEEVAEKQEEFVGFMVQIMDAYIVAMVGSKGEDKLMEILGERKKINFSKWKSSEFVKYKEKRMEEVADIFEAV